MSGRLHEMGDASRVGVESPGEGATQPRLVVLRMFSRHWLLATILVVIGVAINIRLGIWQLDRLEQRRAFNSRVSAQIDQPVLELNEQPLGDASYLQSLSQMEYRSVRVTGEYDLEHEVALRNQAWGNQIGVQVLTPLRISGSDQVILVNRGWVPIQGSNYESWSSYPEPGTVEVQGVIRASQSKPDYGSRQDQIPAAGDEPLKAWYFANIEGIAQQMPYPLLPVYIQQSPDSSWTQLPYRSQVELDLSEGPHQSYAIQWFTFAAILGLGYPFYIRRQDRKRRLTE